MFLRPIGPMIVLACAAVLLAGCSKSEDDEAPSACLTGAAGYLTTLKTAPGEVRLGGETPISECLVPDQGAGELEQVGGSMIEAATKLNEAAQADPAGPEAVQLGYLVGAVERGADSIHADLARRIEAAARFSEQGQVSPEFQAAYERGLAAGKESG